MQKVAGWLPGRSIVKLSTLNMTNMVILRYNPVMRTVNISDLKAQLSAHIQLVKDGEEVLVCDRNKPVARIIPYLTEGESERERELMARGILTPPLKPSTSDVSWPEPPGNIPDDVIEQIWREERNR